VAYIDRNHDAENMCSQIRGTGSIDARRCYRTATVVAVAPANNYTELFCNRHASFVRKGAGSSIFATLVRAGVANLTAVR
jgi:hypothetical protein